MKRIIIFGATGGIGAYTALELRDRYEVIAIGRREDNGFFRDHGIEYIRCDITKKGITLLLPQPKYAVINLAAMLPARMNGYRPQEYIDTIMNLDVLNYTLGAEKYLYFQSFSDVRHLWSKMPIPADSESRFPLNNDHSVYSICKTAAMNLSIHYGAKYGFQCFVIRLPNVYIYHPDPYYYLNGERRWQNYRLMINKAINGQNIEIWDDPNKVRDILYVKDVINIIRLSLESNIPGIYNAGTGIGTTLEDQIKGIVQIFGGSYSYKPNNYSTIEYIMDISKTVKNLGYKPHYDYLTYLRDFKNEMELNRFEKLWGKPLQ